MYKSQPLSHIAAIKWNLKLKTIPFILASSQINYLDINLAKMYDIFLSEVNYKTLMKELKEELNREIFHVHEGENSVLSRCLFFFMGPID